MANVAIGKNGLVKSQKSYIARTFDDNPDHAIVKLPDDETKCALMLNLLMSEGYPLFFVFINLNIFTL